MANVFSGKPGCFFVCLVSVWGDFLALLALLAVSARRAEVAAYSIVRCICGGCFDFFDEALVLIVSPIFPNGVIAAACDPFIIDLADNVVLVKMAAYVSVAAEPGTRYEDGDEAFDTQHGSRRVACRADSHGKVLAIARLA